MIDLRAASYSHQTQFTPHFLTFRLYMASALRAP